MAHVFDIDDDAATSLTMTRYRSFFIYGLTRHGKTRFIGTCPNVCVIADASERGYTTLKTMKGQADAYYHADQGPFVIAVENAAEMNLALAIVVAPRWPSSTPIMRAIWRRQSLTAGGR